MSGGYDERLLASAPAATRAEKQEGYNIDLLENGRTHNPRSNSTTPPPGAAPALSTDHSKAEAGGYGSGYAPGEAEKPWYKTRKWLVIFFIAGLVIVGAIVGGAVGGTVGKNSNSSSSLPAPGSTSQAQGGGEAEGASSAQSTSATATSQNTTPGPQATTQTDPQSPAQATTAQAPPGAGGGVAGSTDGKSGLARISLLDPFQPVATDAAGIGAQ